jgi:uncharacterized membrane protein (DUF4010 family)
MFFLTWISPTAALDPWHILSPKKISTVIFALTFIQAMSSTIATLLGARTGAILTGFFGGLISSTATTAALARNSKTSDQDETATQILTFLSATAAMLIEGAIFVVLGASKINLTILLIFAGPLLVTIFIMLIQSQKLTRRKPTLEPTQFEILPILKLSAFIVAILSLSKVLQIFVGQNGLIVLTFIVSLFEIHGSVIANIQLYNAGIFDIRLLGGLLVISITASYTSKLFLISKLGTTSLRTKAFKSTFFLFLSLILSWGFFLLLSEPF